METATRRRVLRRNMLKRQCVRTAFVMLFLSWFPEGEQSSPSSGATSNSGGSTPFVSSTCLFVAKKFLAIPQESNASSHKSTVLQTNLFRRGKRQRQKGPTSSEDSPSVLPNESSSSSPEKTLKEEGRLTAVTLTNHRHHHHHHQYHYLPGSPPPPQDHLPLRFLRAGNNDPAEGWRRYRATLQWRREHGMDQILREPSPYFDLIQQHYLHYFHGTGYRGEPVFYEIPGKTNLPALREGGVRLPELLRYYSQITEFQWQYLNRDDHGTSIYVVDLQGIRLTDFVGETRDFVLAAARLAAQHYPERGGKVLLIHVPRWFQIIWRVIRPVVSESTLDKIFLLRGDKEIRQRLQEFVPLEQIPREYGGTSPIPLGESREEKLLAELMQHNNLLAEHQQAACHGCSHDVHPDDWPCRFCRWTPARSY